jgi:hypothetical protein
MGSLAIRKSFFDLPLFVRVLVQVLAVVVCATIGSFVAGRLRFGSPLNLTWAGLLPVVVGVLLNRGITNRIALSGLWIVLSFATIALMANVAGLGPD